MSNGGDGGFLVVSYDKIENETCNEQILFMMVHFKKKFDLIYILRTKLIVITCFPIDKQDSTSFLHSIITHVNFFFFQI